jgi:hypothetical protein
MILPALAACVLLMLVAIVALIVQHDERVKRKKDNVRVPRETLWERTNRYHGEPK